MRFLLIVALSAASCGTGSSTLPSIPYSPTSPIQTIEDSAGQSFCTAFSINKDARLYLTAAHCVDPDDAETPVPHMFHVRVVLVTIDRAMDLAVVRAAFGEDALTVSPVAPVFGDSISAIGYALGARNPVVAHGVFVRPLAAVKIRDVSGIFFRAIFSMPAEEGMSGGPVLNEAGQVVSVLQLRFRDFSESAGSNYELMRRFVEPFTQDVHTFQ